MLVVGTLLSTSSLRPSFAPLPPLTFMGVVFFLVGLPIGVVVLAGMKTSPPSSLSYTHVPLGCEGLLELRLELRNTFFDLSLFLLR